jgi:hypothetical protein
VSRLIARAGLGTLAVLILLAPAPSPAAVPDRTADLPPGDLPPPTAFTRLEAAGTAADHPGFDHLIVHEELVNHVDERGVARTEGYILYKVLTEAGCRGMSALDWGYDPQSKEVEVREVSLLREGERIPVSLEELRDLPAPQAAIYWRDRIKALQLPRLEVGDGIEVKTSTRGFTYALLAEEAGAATGSGEAAGEADEDDERFIPPMPGEYFEIVLFQAGVPILEKRHEVHLPPGKLLHSQVYNGALQASTSYDEQGNTYAWWGRDLPAASREPRQPDASDYVSKVVLATVESWEAKSRWFFEVNDNQFDNSPAIAAKVRQILEETGTAGGSEAEKADALVHWVAQNIRYSGQTMGKGEGFTLHPGTMILEQRSGVCKDIAGMLITMMRAAEIEAYAAMTMAGSRIEEVPADQFNHCVVARRDGDDWVMYDPTWVPYNDDIWSKRETEQHYLIGSPEGEGLAQIPYSPPAESPLKLRHEARLAEDGSLEGELRLYGEGASDGTLRRLVVRTPRREFLTRVAGILSHISPGLASVTVEFRKPDDFSGGMWIEIGYRAEGFALPVDGGLEFTSPAMALIVEDGSLFGAGGRRWPEERSTDLLLWATQLVDARESIRLPRGFVMAPLPEAREREETYASFQGEASEEEGTLSIRSRAEIRRRQIPPEGYGGFLAALDEAREWSATVFRAEREEVGR